MSLRHDLTMLPILGLTVRHPWATAIAWLHKDIENRVWHPLNKKGAVPMYLAIHGGTTPITEYHADYRGDVDALSDLLMLGGRLHPLYTEQWTAEERIAFLNRSSTGEQRFWVQTGIVAVTKLVLVTRNHPSVWAARNQFNWVLEETVRLSRPVRPSPGPRKDLWALDERTLAAVRREYAAARRAA